jgi:hypothetical protein
MRRFMSICLFLLIMVTPGIYNAGGYEEDQSIDRLALEIATATN